MVFGVLWPWIGGVVAQQVQGNGQQLLHHAVVRYQRAQARVLLQEPLHIENNQDFKGLDHWMDMYLVDMYEYIV